MDNLFSQQCDFKFNSNFHGVAVYVENHRLSVAEISCKDNAFSLGFFKEQDFRFNIKQPEEFVIILDKILKEADLPQKNMVISLPSSLFEMDIQYLPPVRPKDLEEIIHRKLLRAERQTPQGQAWCYKILETRAQDKAKGARVLVVKTPLDTLNAIHLSLERHGLANVSITTSLAGVTQLINHMDTDGEVNSVLAIESYSQGAMLYLFRKGLLNQIRNIKGDNRVENDKFIKVLNAEIQRTISFHKQKYKGEEISRHLVVGGGVHSLHLPTALLPDPLTSPEIQNDSEEAPCEKSLISIMIGVLKTAHKTHGSGLNLSFNKPKKRLAALVSAACLFLICSLAGVIAFTDFVDSNIKDHQKQLEELKDKPCPITDRTEERDQLLIQREIQTKMDKIHSDFSNVGKNTANALLFIKNNLPQESKVLSITYNKVGENPLSSTEEDVIELKLQNDFTGYKSAYLKKFIQKLRMQPGFHNVSFQTSGLFRIGDSEKKMSEIIDVKMTVK